jgi:hypothetical protein
VLNLVLEPHQLIIGDFSKNVSSGQFIEMLEEFGLKRRCPNKRQVTFPRKGIAKLPRFSKAGKPEGWRQISGLALVMETLEVDAVLTTP